MVGLPLLALAVALLAARPDLPSLPGFGGGGATPAAPSPPATAGGSSPTAPAGPSIPLPTIAQFELRPDPRDATRLILAWKVGGRADEVTINGERMREEGSRAVDAARDQSFTLVARNGSGSVSKSLGVMFLRPPEISSFVADRNTVRAGEQVTLSWSVKGAERADINGQAASTPEGSLIVIPQVSNNFVLTAENSLGKAVQIVSVTVIPPTPANR